MNRYPERSGTIFRTDSQRSVVGLAAMALALLLPSLCRAQHCFLYVDQLVAISTDGQLGLYAFVDSFGNLIDIRIIDLANNTPVSWFDRAMEDSVTATVRESTMHCGGTIFSDRNTGLCVLEPFIDAMAAQGITAEPFIYPYEEARFIEAVPSEESARSPTASGKPVLFEPPIVDKFDTVTATRRRSGILEIQFASRRQTANLQIDYRMLFEPGDNVFSQLEGIYLGSSHIVVITSSTSPDNQACDVTTTYHARAYIYPVPVLRR